MADGSQHALFLYPESKYGVPPSESHSGLNGETKGEEMRLTTLSLNATREEQPSAEIRSDRMLNELSLGQETSAGDLNFEFSFTSFDRLLSALLGSNWEGSEPQNPSTLKLGTLRKSFTALRVFNDLGTYASSQTDKYWEYPGLEVNQMTLTLAAKQKITGAFSFVGLGLNIHNTVPNYHGSGGEGANAATTTPVMNTFTGAVKIDPLDKEGQPTEEKPLCVISEMSLTITNGLTERPTVGTCSRLRSSQARLSVTGTATAYFETAELFQMYKKETELKLVIELKDRLGNKYDLELPRIKFGSATNDVSGEGGITVPLTFTALSSLVMGEKTNIKITRSALKPEV